MFDFDAALKAADYIIFETFANVRVTYGGRYIKGIYDNPAAISQVASGFIEHTSDELFIQTKDAPNITRRDEFTLHFSDGKSQKCLVVFAAEDGDGITKITLSKHDEQSKPNRIRY